MKNRAHQTWTIFLALSFATRTSFLHSSHLQSQTSWPLLPHWAFLCPNPAGPELSRSLECLDAEKIWKFIGSSKIPQAFDRLMQAPSLNPFRKRAQRILPSIFVWLYNTRYFASSLLSSAMQWIITCLRKRTTDITQATLVCIVGNVVCLLFHVTK